MAITTSPKPPGSRSKWSTSTLAERVLWLVMCPLRAVICFTNVTLFFIAYMAAMLPVFWLKDFWPRFYWYYEGILYRGLQAFIGYWGYTADYDVYEYGDDITPYGVKDRVLLICNHQSTADVPTLFAALQNKGVATRKTIWLMDVMFRWTPFGIIGRMHGDYFIQQGKATRDKELQRLKDHLKKVFWDRDRRWVILFPEGGFLYKRKEISQRYAREHGYPHLEHITLPRMGAIKAILEEVGPRVEEDDAASVRPNSVLKNSIKLIRDTVGAIREKKYVKDTRPPIDYILDVTIAYPNGQPLSIGTLMFGTRESCDISIHYKMHRAETVPFQDDEALQKWMYDLFQNKDRLLGNYYATGEFNPGEGGRRIVFPWKWIIARYVMWLAILVVEALCYWFLLGLIFGLVSQLFL